MLKLYAPSSEHRELRCLSCGQMYRSTLHAFRCDTCKKNVPYDGWLKESRETLTRINHETR